MSSGKETAKAGRALRYESHANLAEEEEGILEGLQLLAAIVERELPRGQGRHTSARSLVAEMQQLKHASVPVLSLALKHLPAHGMFLYSAMPRNRMPHKLSIW